MKLAVFVDQVYWFDGQAYSTDESYVLFPASFASTFDQIVFIGRLAPGPARKPYVLDQPGLQVCPLPYYESVYDLWKAGPSLYREIRQVVRANADDWDVVWVCGPNPVGQFIAEQCAGLGRPVFLVVRQNLARQVSFSNSGIKRVLAVTMAKWLEWRFRRLARGRTVFAVGQEMAKAYAGATSRTHVHTPCLIGEAQMAALAAMPIAPDPARLLCVGRLSPEKGYHHLLSALALLKSRGVICSLDVVGSGPSSGALKEQAVGLGLGDVVTFHGYVAYGPELLALYQKAAALVVPSLSEGFPQVITEALCVGLPTVASAVGGIPAWLTHLQTAMLVPPGDVGALAEAIEQLLASPDLQGKLRQNGRALIRGNTLEAQRERMVKIIQTEVLSRREGSYRSALADYPGGRPPVQPTVSAVIPVYNEIAHIGSVAEAMLAQDYPGLTEIWFVDGQSDDGTFAELQHLGQRDPRVQVLCNPRRNQGAGINLAFSQAKGDILMRLDAHAQYASDVIRQSVRVLLQTGAGGVGAIARPLSSDTTMGQAIAAAHESKLGVGVAKFRQASASGWADTVWNGCYWKYVVEQVGPLLEDSSRTEDNDFNARVRALGYGLYLSPDIQAYYYPRQSLRELWRQYFANGVGVMQALFGNLRAVGLRHLMPLAFVVGLLLSPGISAFWPRAFLLPMSVLLLYLVALIVFSIIAWRRKPGRYIMLLPVVFMTLHFSYGLGSLWAVAQLAWNALKRARAAIGHAGQALFSAKTKS